jgi:hypothetical protein
MVSEIEAIRRYWSEGEEGGGRISGPDNVGREVLTFDAQ